MSPAELADLLEELNAYAERELAAGGQDVPEAEPRSAPACSPTSSVDQEGTRASGPQG
jgi:hypothetical protein